MDGRDRVLPRERVLAVRRDPPDPFDVVAT
jgi:hypothetical protein